MAWWKRNYGDEAAREAEDLAYPPGGGTGKLTALGVLLPLLISWFAVSSWITEQAVWPGQRGTTLTIRGPEARWMAGAYLGIALFCHFRWCWGLLGFYRTFEIGTVLSLLAFLGCGIRSFWLLVF